jgi:hypothetical protein
MYLFSLHEQQVEALFAGGSGWSQQQRQQKNVACFIIPNHFTNLPNTKFFFFQKLDMG